MSQYEPETTVVHKEGDTVVVEKLVPVREGTSPAVWALVGVLAVIVVLAVAWLFTRNDDDVALDAQAAAAEARADQAVTEANAARADAALSDARARFEASSGSAARDAADSANAAAARAEAAAIEAQTPPPPAPAEPAGVVIVTPSSPQP